jgi:hypothetical protein
MSLILTPDGHKESALELWNVMSRRRASLILIHDDHKKIVLRLGSDGHKENTLIMITDGYMVIR